MIKHSYSDKLKDPRWQKKRLEIFERDKFKCRICQGEKTTLHVHHIEYSGDPWEQDNHKLITLCEDCHSIIEVWIKQKIYLNFDGQFKVIKLRGIEKKVDIIIFQHNDIVIIKNIATGIHHACQNHRIFNAMIEIFTNGLSNLCS